MRDRGLIDYHPLSRNARDYSGKRHHGVVSGSLGWSAQGAVFASSADTIEIDSTDLLNVAALTIIAVVRLSTTSQPAYAKIVEKDYNGNSSPYVSFDLSLDNLTRKAMMEISTGGSITSCAGTTVLDADKEYFLTGTWDGSNIRIYVNGILENTVAKSGTLNFDNTKKLRIGCSRNAGTENFLGTIREVYLFNRALSAMEIMRYYAKTRYDFLRTYAFLPQYNMTIQDSFSGALTLLDNMPLLAETLSNSETLTPGQELSLLLAEILSNTEGLAGGFGFALADSFDLPNTLTGNIAVSALEALSMSETLQYAFAAIVRQTVFFYNSEQIGYSAKASTTLDFVEILIGSAASVIRDYLMLSAAPASLYEGTETVKQRVTAYDLAAAAKVFLDVLAETLSTAPTPAYVHARLEKIREALSLAPLVLSKLDAGKTAGESLSATDRSLFGWEKVLQESATLGESLFSLYILALTANDLLTATGEGSVTRGSNVLVVSTVTAGGTASAGGALTLELTDTVGFLLRVVLDGEAYQCWALTTNELYPSVYAHFPFVSYATFSGKLYGAKSDGIYLIGGTTDAGTAIATGVRLNLFNMGTHLGKRLLKASFGLSGAKPALKVTTENGSVKYFVVNGKADVAKGQEGREWVFDLADIDDLEFVELTPILLSR
ncbi:MAG: LamG domain-containing protein [Alphaproteobacteria bacterium]|uniref:LamG domain-containing protein n=1 Tax=Candidatus Nitrobium versatile TaxID=2884831 RepID=A0A953M3P4_9BACT|nr:LamG domain-containing protein [Candidatus Nitrobium versatile]